MSAGYADDLARIHAEGFTDLARAAAREALDRLPGGGAPARVLDLGCGDGTTLAVLAGAGHDVVGLDRSAAMLGLARRRVPGGTFHLGSFVDAELPGRFDAVLAVGEVLGYALDARNDHDALDAVFARVRRALWPGGLFLFDLAGPGRAGAAGSSGWAEGDGWTVLHRAREEGADLVREIVTFRAESDGRWRRTGETHRLRLHDPQAVLDRLRAAGFGAYTLPGYAGEPLPPGWTVFVAD